MSRRTTGTIFCAVAAMLFSVRYLCAAIFMSNVASWSGELFKAGLRYAGPHLRTLGILFLIAGVAYLIAAELSDFIKKRKN